MVLVFFLLFLRNHSPIERVERGNTLQFSGHEAQQRNDGIGFIYFLKAVCYRIFIMINHLRSRAFQAGIFRSSPPISEADLMPSLRGFGSGGF